MVAHALPYCSLRKEGTDMEIYLSAPQLLEFTLPDGSLSHGANQDWYRDEWQRRAGCGPTTASTAMYYLAQVHPSLRPLAPEPMPASADFLPHMEAVWPHVTPGKMGLNKVPMYTDGCKAFAAARGCTLVSEELLIPGRCEQNRPTAEECLDFIARALRADRPVAFLNYTNGALTNLDSWHWVPLISLREEGDALLCEILDDEKCKVIDFALWLRTTFKGGALAVMGPAE